MGGSVRTVLGDVLPGSLGPTYAHEHLLARPGGDWARGDADLALDDEDRSALDLEMFLRVGGRGLVDATTEELGRNPEGLRRLSARTGVHVVACTGHVSEEHCRGAVDLDAASESELAERLVRDLSDGLDGTSVRAGVIKVGSSVDRVTGAERKLMRAAAAAHRETGAPITTHTSAGTAALEQVRVLEGVDADLTRVCIGHLDRRLVWADHVALARSGVYLGYDCVGKEQYQPDAERVRFITRLIREGHGEQVLLAGDMARRRYLVSWGGAPGYAFIIRDFLPLLRQAGVGEEEIGGLMVDNPARFLAWA
ncbi:MAG: phosphotriesterase family protein [Actinomycetota bacterium]